MAGTFASLIVSGVVFHGSHIALSSTRLRGNLRDQLGERGYLALYSVVSLATFAWFVTAYIHAPALILWHAPPWMVLVPVGTGAGVAVGCAVAVGAADPAGEGDDPAGAAVAPGAGFAVGDGP